MGNELGYKPCTRIKSKFVPPEDVSDDVFTCLHLSTPNDRRLDAVWYESSSATQHSALQWLDF